MAVPKRKHSNSRTGKRRSHGANGLRHVVRKGGDYIEQLTTCPQCQAAIPTHVVCPVCGYYGGQFNGRTVVDMTE